MIITIDGTAGSGKGTLASAIALKYGFFWLDSGLIYRILAFVLFKRKKCLSISFTPDDINFLKFLQFSIQGKEREIYIATCKYPQNTFRTENISSYAAKIAVIPDIRLIVQNIQKKFLKEHQHIIAEGRDQGTVIFPQADLKFFLTASVQIRALRRMDQLGISHTSKNIQFYEKNIIDRDFSDKNRHISPLICPKGAIYIDNSSQTFNETFNHVIQEISKIFLKDKN